MSRFLLAGGGTGGHLMPALAIGAALRALGHEVTLVGASRGVEARLLPMRDFPYRLLPAEPIYRRQWWRNLRWPVLAIRLRRETDALLRALRPDVVLGTGGYAAGPVVWRAAEMGIPTAILEQDARPGLATRLLAKRAREIYLGQAETRASLRPGPRTQVHVTGCPITPPDLRLRDTGFEHFGLDPVRPVLLVTGGSQGSLAINEAVAELVVGRALSGVQVLWATGSTTYSRFRHLHAPPEVQVFDFLDPIQPALAIATVALTRAGMMTLAELCAWGVPSVVVPLPTAAQDHQSRNAKVLADAGGCVLVRQEDLPSGALEGPLRRLIEDEAVRRGVAAAALGRGRPTATGEISGLLVSLSTSG